MVKPAFDYRSLSIPERIALVGDIWDSIVEEAPDAAFPLTPELAAELDRRVAEHEADPGSARPWDEVRAEIERDLRDRGRGSSPDQQRGG